jgi:hypothetical protein
MIKLYLFVKRVQTHFSFSEYLSISRIDSVLTNNPTDSFC